MTHSEKKLEILRTSMKGANIDAYIIPLADPHLGEYIPAHWGVIGWLTGFTGSAATVVVTEIFAGLWTDSRYFIQAENQLKDSGFILMKPLLPIKNDYYSWLAENLKTEAGLVLTAEYSPLFHEKAAIIDQGERYFNRDGM